jgi:hypothetical protein
VQSRVLKAQTAPGPDLGPSRPFSSHPFKFCALLSSFSVVRGFLGIRFGGRLGVGFRGRVDLRQTVSRSVFDKARPQKIYVCLATPSLNSDSL